MNRDLARRLFELFWWWLLVLLGLLLLWVLGAGPVRAEDLPDWVHAPQPELRQLYRNPDGSCVQCSLGIAGLYHDQPAAQMLLWQSPYGPAVRGGSWPDRVTQYCQARGIPIYNVVGGPAQAYLDWALRNGREAAITWGVGHMITAVGLSPDGQTYAVCDNNTPGRIDYYRREQFLRGFRGYPGGGWVVVIAGPVPTPVKPPQLLNWWSP